MTATEVAAWIGAGTGTAAILWDIYKWWTSGPNVTITVAPNMTMMTGGKVSKQKYMMVAAVNTGTAKTTLTTLAWRAYPSRLWALLRRRASQMITINIQPTPLPHPLDVGETWTTTVPEDDRIGPTTKAAVIECLLYHAWSPKPAKARVRFPRVTPET